jgi:hypothetical protein
MSGKMVRPGPQRQFQAARVDGSGPHHQPGLPERGKIAKMDVNRESSGVSRFNKLTDFPAPLPKRSNLGLTRRFIRRCEPGNRSYSPIVLRIGCWLMDCHSPTGQPG